MTGFVVRAGKLTLLLLAVAPTVFAHGDYDERYARALAATCTGCHAPAAGTQTAMPRLAGRKAEYIVQQMRAFKAGERPSTVMQQLARGYTDEQIEFLAEYFEQLK